MFCVYASEEPNSFKAMFTSIFYMIEVGSGDPQVRWVSAKGKSADYPCSLNQHHGKAKCPLGNNSGDDFLTRLHLRCTFSMKPVAQTSPRLFWVWNEIMLKYNINNLGMWGSLNWDWDSYERWNQNWNIFLATGSPDSTSAIEKQRAAQTYTIFFFSENPHPMERRLCDHEPRARRKVPFRHHCQQHPKSHGRSMGSHPLACLL